MMNLETFRDVLLDEISHKLPPGYTLNVSKVVKESDIEKTGISIAKEGSALANLVYAEDLFGFYEKGVTTEEIADTIMVAVNEDRFDQAEVPDFSRQYLLDNVYFRMANAEKNQRRFADVPTKRPPGADDILLYPCIDVYVAGKTGVTTIHNDNLEQSGISVEELHAAAESNTEKRLEIIPLAEKLAQALPEGTMEFFESPFHVTNDKVEHARGGMSGASVFGAPKLLATLKEPYYIVPSSVHECLFLPVSFDPTPDRLISLMDEVNSGEAIDPITGERVLKEEDVLSDRLYVVDKGVVRTVNAEAGAEAKKTMELE